MVNWHLKCKRFYAYWKFVLYDEREFEFLLILACCYGIGVKDCLLKQVEQNSCQIKNHFKGEKLFLEKN